MQRVYRDIIINMDQARQQNKQSHHKRYHFHLGTGERNISIDADFDSGNIKVVKQLSQFQYRLECFEDGAFTGKPVNSKTWFYFRVTGFPNDTKGKFIVSKVHALSSIFYSKFSKCYRPVYRQNNECWKRFTTQVPLSVRQNGDLECTIQYVFKKQQDSVEFAFCYPYQFSQNIAYLQNVNRLAKDNDVYLHKEILIQSPQKRPIHLLTITSNEQHQDREKEEQFNSSLFPQKCRPYKFKKPVVLITARVHPGQTPASYTMEGVINFLIDKHDLRAHLLRKMFVFLIVPMINVDGVYHGHFRMDIFGKNLNRFYINPNCQQQPAIYAIKELANHLIAQNRLSFYFDLHGHNAKKGCFIYGNAFSDFVQQVESQVFCKLFAMNHSGFQYQYCNFSQKHMNAKDRFQDLTKQGCGRVVMYKAANIIHSYSVQCGIISPNHANVIPQPINRQFRVGQKGFINQDIEENYMEGQKLADDSILFTEDAYRNLGKNLLVSILDVFDKNPYNRVYNSRYKSMETLRRLTAFEIFHSADRFRMFERYIFGKVKNINLLIQEIISNKIPYKQLYNCYFNDDVEFMEVDWPKNILGLIKTIKVELGRVKKFKSAVEGKNNVNQQEWMPASEQKSLKNIKYVNLDKFLDEHKYSMIKLSHQYNQQIEEKQANDLKITGIHTVGLPIKTNLQPIQNVRLSKQQDNSPSHLQIEACQINSDGSQVQQTQMNQQILMMCEDEREENEIINKIMLNNFNEKDYEQIQQKFKCKNYQEQEETQKQSNVSMSRTESPAKIQKKNQMLPDFSSTKDNKYRPNSKKVQNQVSKVYMKGNQKKVQIVKDRTFQNSIEPKQKVNEIRKMTAAEQFRKNIYDSIKQQIKEGLRRQYQRKKLKEKMQSKLIDSFRLKSNNRVRVALNFTDSKRIKSKVRLPSLGTNMYIITTSTRLIHKS